MTSKRKPALIAGLALGVLYLVEAVIATGLFFALWPVLGGIFAASLLSWDEAITAGSGARVGAKAGLIGAATLLVVGTPVTLYLLERLGEEPGLFGATLNLDPLPTLLIFFAGYGLFGIAVAATAGAVTGLLRGRGSAGSR